MNGHYAAAGNKVARHSLYEVGQATIDSYGLTRHMNPYRWPLDIDSMDYPDSSLRERP
jgi:hypothetical protein